MTALTFTSLISTVADPLCQATADYLTERLQRPVTFVAAAEPGRREALLDGDAIDLVWLCGLLYLHKVAAGTALVPAVAPAMLGEEPAGEPRYYADLIVQNGSAHQTFADLRGTRWAYNERASFSGYQVVRAHLAQLGARGPYFGEMLRSGSHLQSIDLVREGVADCAAIDSTVIQMLQRREPARLTGVRTVARLGPHPMPPLAFAAHVVAAERQPVIDVLTTMHREPAGEQLLAEWQIERFVAVDDATYQPLHVAQRAAQMVDW